MTTFEVGVPQQSLRQKALELRRLHTDPALLVLVNVWDVASATTVAAAPGCRALATASEAIAAVFGYPDGERIPVDLMLDMVARIAGAVDLPVTADLEAGYGDVGRSIARAIAAGAAGANLEDRMQPLSQSAALVGVAVRTAEQEGVPLVLNARTDAYLSGGGRSPREALAEARQRGRAFLDAGASCVFVPGVRSEEDIRNLVDAFGLGKLSLLCGIGTPSPSVLASIGVARISYGPYPHRGTLASLAKVAATLLSGDQLGQV